MTRAPLLLLVVLLAPGAAAHGSGGTGFGDSLADATPLGIPAYVFAQAPDGTSVHYVQLDTRTVDVRLRLATPVGREPTQLPVVFVFGAELPANVSVPSDVERPAYGGVAFPAAERASVDVPELGARWSVLLERELYLQPGEHIVAVRTQSSGPLALVLEEVGSAGVIERAVLPGLRDDARAWAGAPAWPTLGAGALAVAAVGAYAWRERASARSFLSASGYAAAAFFGASALSLATDALRSGAGWLLALAGIACALGAAATSRTAGARPGWRPRLGMLVIAGAGFWLYAGALWGPLTALAGALLPEPSVEKPA